MRASVNTEALAVPGRLRSLLIKQPDPILLIGAGASVSSGVPAAGPAVERMARWRWCLDNGRSPNDPSVRPADYRPWLTKLPWFTPDAALADLYPTAVKSLLNVASDRREFLEDMINPAVGPGPGYRALANILHAGHIRTLLTTNFDECLQRARELVARPHHLVTVKTPSDLVRFSSAPAYPQLLYLHGSVEHLTDKNLDADVQTLDPSVVERVRPMLRDHPIIVVGYRGAEPSIMRGLFLDNVDYANSFQNGVYWCLLEREAELPLPPMVAELSMRIGGNFSKVPIRNFDELMGTELWKPLAAERRPRDDRPAVAASSDVPFDMRPVTERSLDDIDLVLLFTRLVGYMGVLGSWAPDAYDRDWTVETAKSFHLLAQPNEGAVVPTAAGLLLFSRDPSHALPSARISLRVEGPVRWLKECFGGDVELTGVGEDAALLSEISGNLWSQLDQITELLSSVNRQFRLKQEVSRQVRSYSPLALKEMAVNALVHRDYETDALVEILVTPARIETLSPGGLIAAVAAQISGEGLEKLIKSGRRNIKGYRNPVIADLFYGGGHMDHTGSGLSDMWRETINNNGDVNFGPDKGNGWFSVSVNARPEAVDEITNTAVADETYASRFTTNLLPVVSLPAKVWHAGTPAANNRALYRSADEGLVPPGLVQDGRFYTLYDLDGLADDFPIPFDPGDVEAMAFDELLDVPNGTNIAIHLLQEAVLGHCKALGMQVDHRRKRAHFPRLEDGDERRVTYQAKYKRATRTVVKVRTRRDSEDVLYFEHKAVSISILPAGDEWCVVLTPGYAFTRNGFGKLIGNEKINSLSTRRAAKDFNANVHNDLTFWLAMLTEGASGVFSLIPDVGSDLEPFAPNILLSDQLAGATLNSGAFDDFDPDEAALDADMDELEGELARLAEEEEFDADVADDDDGEPTR